jgi:uncharacterized repeat protein (TIGR01451 family)
MHARKRIALCLLFLAMAALSNAAIARVGLPARNSAWAQSQAARAAPEPKDILSSPQARARIEPALLRALLTTPAAPIRYIIYLRAQSPLDTLPAKTDRLEGRQAVVAALQSTAQESQAELAARLAQEQQAGQVESYQPLWICNAIAVQGSAQSVAHIAALSEVSLIRLDRKHRLESSMIKEGESQNTSWGIARIGADLVWQRLGIDGRGVVVATMDSGVDGEHPALKARYRGYTARGPSLNRGNWFCVTPEGYTKPTDGLGHGTHVLGTILGENGIGVAPGAKWIAAKVFDDYGFAYDSWLHAGFQWMLAPNGNESLAPDILNCSWGSALGGDETFRLDLRALRAAGILPIFSAGNAGPAAESINSPASYPEALAVGASDMRDRVASFSGRGPSTWQENKPEILAPGVDILSSVPGGGYALLDGTSMAAPHVSGAAALLLQARPGLSADQIEQTLVSNATGSAPGRLDVYQSIVSVAEPGLITGVVRRASDLAYLGGATVAFSAQDGTRSSRARTDQHGRYEAYLAPGVYEINAALFGFVPAETARVEIGANTSAEQNFLLERLPVGAISGRIVDQLSGQPLAARVSASGLLTTTTDALGVYTLELPAGRYELSIASAGHRIGRVAVETRPDETAIQDVALARAPSILLVDSGAWYYDSQAAYFQQALDQLAYLYDVRTIHDTISDWPTAETLAAYDIVIWSCPADSPGLIGADGALTAYLEGGGKLLLTGQDIAFWDGGGAIFTYAPYFTTHLKAAYVRDNAASAAVLGTAGDIFGGLSLPLNGPDSARDQLYPDEIASADLQSALPVLLYEEGGGAGLRIGSCLPYRTIYIAAGLEGMGDRDSRSEIIGRAIQWLTTPPALAGIELSASAQPALPLAGAAMTHTVHLRNTGTLTDTYELDIISSGWPATLWDAHFRQPLTESLMISSCRSVNIGLRVEAPEGALRDSATQTVLRVRSGNAPTLTREITLTSKLPAGVLLVDDDRWVNVESAYEEALRITHIAYDRWEVGWNVGDARGSPPLGLLQQYPLLIWFTGGDWSNTLSPQEEERLAAYLDGGGRVFFSSQDYLYSREATPFATDYFGVLTYTEDLTTTLAYSAENLLFSDGRPYSLTYPYANWSDIVMPTEQAQVAFYGSHNRPCALAWKAPNGSARTLFFAFPFETLQATDTQDILREMVFWLSPLGDSTLAADKRVAQNGETLTYTLALRNNGAATTVWCTNTLPAELGYIPGSLQGGGGYDAATRTVRWQGPLAAGETITLTYRAQLAAGLAQGQRIANPVHLRLAEGLGLTREMVVRANAPDLIAHKEAHTATILPWEPLTYTITLENRGLRAASATLTDALPTELYYITDSAQASAGHFIISGDEIRWDGEIGQGEQVSIRYRAAPRKLTGGRFLVNLATTQDGRGVQLWPRSRVFVLAPAYLPLLLKR